MNKRSYSTLTVTVMLRQREFSALKSAEKNEVYQHKQIKKYANKV